MLGYFKLAGYLLWFVLVLPFLAWLVAFQYIDIPWLKLVGPFWLLEALIGTYYLLYQMNKKE